MNVSAIKVHDVFEPFIKELLNSDPFEFCDLPEVSIPLLKMLSEGGFLIPEHFDEKKEIEKRYINQPGDKTLSITIVPTLNCNLSCLYCYQEHDKSKMTFETADKITAEIEKMLPKLKPGNLEIDWYGGEPLLAPKIIEYLSGKLIYTAKQFDIPYAATVTTNATLINDKLIKLLADSQVEELQITLDGPPSIHNINRPYSNGKPSFEAVLNGITKALDYFDVNLRINVNKDSIGNSLELLNILKEKYLFNRPKELRPYIAMIGPLSYACSHTAKNTMPLDEFFSHVLKFQKEIIKLTPNGDIKRILEFPKVLNRACGAQSQYSLCIHPEGRVFKCGLEVHDLNLGGDFIWEDYQSHPNYKKWMNVNPLEIEECNNCKFLPICMGGCAKYNFKEGDFYEKESCLYWNNYLKEIIKQYVEVTEKERANVLIE
jgi:uncharacterized protein